MLAVPVNVGEAVGALAFNCVWMLLLTPSVWFSSAAVAVTAVPPTFHDPAVKSGVLAVTPFRTSTT